MTARLKEAPARAVPAPFPEAVGRLAPTIVDVIGNTPLVQIQRLAAEKGVPESVEIYAKLEGMNPSGSVKARAAWFMVKDGLTSGAYDPTRQLLLDSTSGNTGIAYAMIGAVLGLRIALCMPSNVSQERKHILNKYSAEIIFTDALEGSDGALLHARELKDQFPEKYFKPDQYNNPMNPEAHYHTTGPEIWGQTHGRITHFLAGIGTGGTVMGTGRYLREKNRGIKILAVEPAGALHGLEGLKHMGSSIVPGIYDVDFPDETIGVETEDAYDTVQAVAQTDGVLVGQSSGAALYAALELGKTLTDGVLVVIFPDGGDKYLSTALWL